jgi:putative FmdB family regulatory protein
MPLYEYKCPAHGQFDLLRPAADFAAAGECPVCKIACPRIMSAPNIQTLSLVRRQAFERNERSRHAPHVCTSGCGHRHAPAAKSAKSGTLQKYTGPRPWVMEHR